MTSSTEVIIAVDAMGGDKGPAQVVFAIEKSLKKYPLLKILLVGRHAELSPLVSSLSDQSRIEIIHADVTIAMDDKPSKALRRKQDSSMAVALSLVEEGRAQACLSGGNTGALMLLSRSILGVLPGIERPALAKAIPSPKGSSFVLDLGANVDCSAEHLYQYGVLGSLLAETSLDIESPRIALLNVGNEPDKGNELVKVTALMLAENPHLNFIGYVEGDEVFLDKADVILCDGFVGNVALKTGEGVALMLKSLMHQCFQGAWYRKFIGFLAYPFIKRMLEQINPARYNGAQLLGINGIVIKSHGNSDAYGIEKALDLAISEVESGLLERINRRLDDVLY